LISYVRRSLLIAALLLGTAAPREAHACPPLDSCVVHLRTTVRGDATTPVSAPAQRVAEVVRAPVQAPAHVTLDGEIEMPWIWKTLCEQVYSRMPSYEGSTDASHELKIVLAPVVVKSPTDTIPGLGISGDF
jgi:hypothetical protein